MKSRVLTLVAVIFLPFSIWLAVYGSVESDVFRQLSFAHGSILKSKYPSSTSSARNDDKPLFILHIGPEKTGTTTAQWAAWEHRGTLRKDNVYFLGHIGARSDTSWHDLCWSCAQGKEGECQEKWGKLEKTVNAHYHKNYTAFLSEEIFSRYKDKQDEEEHLWKYVVPILSKWHVRTVFTYRRFYEWGPSYYAQLNAPKDKKKRSLWPGSGGQAIPSFPEYFADTMEGHFKRLISLQKRWKARFPDLWVFNMHTGGDYETNFFCQMLPEAKELCETLKSKHKVLTKNQGSSKILHHDMIAVEAYKQGMLHKKVSRVEARKAVELHAKKLGLTSVTDFPRKCLLQNQTEALLKWSVELESQMVPKFYSSSQGEAQLKVGFANSVDTGKFCSVDVEAILKDKRWQDFFQGLGAASKAKSKTSPRALEAQAKF